MSERVWTDALQRAFALYESLWSSEAEEGHSPWVMDRGTPTFIPFDHSDILTGLDLISQHLAVRCSRQRLETTRWEPCVSWLIPGGELFVVEQQLFTVDRQSGSLEAREHILTVATAGTGPKARLLHVAEATPAVLVEVAKSYERHARFAGEL